MTASGPRGLRDERGLIGKILLLWLLLAAFVALAVIDAGAIVIARIHAADLARDASSAGAEEFADSGRRREALRAALAALGEADEDARLDEFEVSRRGAVTVEVSDRAATLLVGRFGLLEDLARATASDTSEASGG